MISRRDQKTPKYITVRTWLHAFIRDEKVKLGDQIPTEEELARKFQVNRMTVRKALDELAVEKIIERRQGIGSFVISKMPAEFFYDTGNIISIVDHFRAYGVEASFKTVKVAVEVPPERERELLLLPQDVAVANIVRIIIVANEPVLLAASFLAPQYEGIVSMDLTKALYELLVEEFHVVLHHSDESYSAINPNDEERRAFLPYFSGPFIKLENTLFEPNGHPIGVFNALFRGDKFKFRAHSMEFLRT